MTPTPDPGPIHFEIVRSRRPGRQRWWWRARANGRIVATAGERYANRAHAVAMAARFADPMGAAIVIKEP